MLASYHGQGEIVRMLLSAGAQANLQNKVNQYYHLNDPWYIVSMCETILRSDLSIYRLLNICLAMGVGEN